MPSYSQGNFTPKYPEKYIGSFPIKFRSSWEQQFMLVLDNHPNVLQWASESVKIPYINPLTGKQTVYVPDFLIVYIDKNSKKHSELVEIKPLKETLTENAKTKKDKLRVALNMAKWKAAYKWCGKRGLQFRVMTEEQLFRK